MDEMSRELSVSKPSQMTVVDAYARDSWKSRTKLSRSPWHDSPETSPLIGMWLPQWLGLFFSHSSSYWSYWPGLGQELQGIRFHPNKGITDSGLLERTEQPGWNILMTSVLGW